MTPADATKKPVHSLAWAALAVAVVAAGFALYGSFLSETHIDGSPLNVARRGTGLGAVYGADVVHVWLPLVAYGLPFVLGLAAALVGGEAMKVVERRGGTHAGSRHAVFAIMIGGLAAVTSGCMMLAIYGWKHVPSLYTN